MSPADAWDDPTRPKSRARAGPPSLRRSPHSQTFLLDKDRLRSNEWQNSIKPTEWCWLLNHYLADFGTIRKRVPKRAFEWYQNHKNPIDIDPKVDTIWVLIVWVHILKDRRPGANRWPSCREGTSIRWHRFSDRWHLCSPCHLPWNKTVKTQSWNFFLNNHETIKNNHETKNMRFWITYFLLMPSYTFVGLSENQGLFTGLRFSEKLVPTFYNGLLNELFWCHHLCQYLSDFYDLKYIRKPFSWAFECILNHKNPIRINKVAGIKLMRQKSFIKKSAPIKIYYNRKTQPCFFFKWKMVDKIVPETCTRKFGIIQKRNIKSVQSNTYALKRVAWRNWNDTCQSYVIYCWLTILGILWNLQDVNDFVSINEDSIKIDGISIWNYC